MVLLLFFSVNLGDNFVHHWDVHDANALNMNLLNFTHVHSIRYRDTLSTAVLWS